MLFSLFVESPNIDMSTCYFTPPTSNLASFRFHLQPHSATIFNPHSHLNYSILVRFIPNIPKCTRFQREYSSNKEHVHVFQSSQHQKIQLLLSNYSITHCKESATFPIKTNIFIAQRHFSQHFLHGLQQSRTKRSLWLP